jgi:hypothetical protein
MLLYVLIMLILLYVLIMLILLMLILLYVLIFIFVVIVITMTLRRLPAFAKSSSQLSQSENAPLLTQKYVLLSFPLPPLLFLTFVQ